MLQIDQGKIIRSEERPLASGVTGVREGQALVADYENGELVVKPSSNATEKFVGIAVSAITPIKSLTKVEVLTTDTNKQVTLAETPLASQHSVFKGTTAQTHDTGNDALASGEYRVSGKTVTLFDASTEYTIYYRYTPSILEVLSIQGDVEPGTHVSDTIETVGVITAGEVFTDEWVTAATVAWQGTSKLATAASGRINTLASSGISNIPGSIITHVPDSESGLLGFKFSV